MALQMHPTSYGSPLIHGDENTVRVGKYCSISDTAAFDGGMHHNTRFATTYPLWKLGCPENRKGSCKGDITVGHDVWIGDGALIMSGVTIGHGAVVGARTVVTHDVSPYAIVAGNPMRFIRWRFPEPIIQRFLSLKWWDWPKEKVMKFSDLMLSEDIEAFLKAAE